MSSRFLTRIALVIQWVAFISLLIFTPLARGGASRWAFCVSLWLVLLAFTSMLLRRLWQGKRLLPHSPLEIPLALLLLIAAASWFVSIYKGATTWALLRLLLYMGVFYLAVEAAESRSQTRSMLIALIGIGTLLTFIGFIKYAGRPLPDFWSYFPRRLNSTFVNRNHFAGYLEMVFALGFGFVLFRPAIRTLTWASCLFLILIALLFTVSRGAWVSTFGALVFMGVFFFLRQGVSKVKIFCTALVLFLVISLSFLGSHAMLEGLQSMGNLQDRGLAYSRIPVWQSCLQIIQENPALGTGLGTFPWSFTSVQPPGLDNRWLHTHNDYIQIVTEIGLLGLIPIMWGLILLFRTGLRTYFRTESRFRAGVTLGALTGIVAILINSLVGFNIQITSNGILFSILIGLVVGQSRKDYSYLSEGS
jgi:O-antigen ligase